jgi:hypothetical protein
MSDSGGGEASAGIGSMGCLVRNTTPEGYAQSIARGHRYRNEEHLVHMTAAPAVMGAPHTPFSH